MEEILTEVRKYDCRNILITGGEPLLQSSTPLLAQVLLDANYRVAIETSGSRPVEFLPREVIKVMDLKTPGSGETNKNRYENLRHLDSKDEVKFVVVDEADVNWSLATIREYDVTGICHVSLSPTDLKLMPMMAQKILAFGKPVRLQHQLHKLVWQQKERGF